MDKLTRSVLIAQAAGMSYGKYMATVKERANHPAALGQEEIVPPEIPLEKECVICGKLFSMNGKRAGTLCCSQECSKRQNAIRARDAYRAKRAAGNIAVCRWCGKQFTKHHGNAAFCSEECSYRKRMADIKKSHQKRKEKKLAESH